jgi:hypothetical protein
VAFRYLKEGHRHDGARCDCEATKTRWLFGKEDDGTVREYYGCPEKLLHDKEVGGWLQLYGEWQVFGLRYPGAAGDQPAVYLDQLMLLESQRIAMDRAKVENAGR